MRNGYCASMLGPAVLSPPFPHDRARHEARSLAPAEGGLLFVQRADLQLRRSVAT
jgi:hypothetical protein